MTYLYSAPVALYVSLSNPQVSRHALDIAHIMENRPKIVLIGVGKSFHAAVMISKMANSFGLRWIAIDATHALHGDIGIIGLRDLVVYLSKSGSSEELLRCARYLDNFRSIAVVCSSRAPLEALVGKTYVLPMSDEYSRYGKAPMLSTIIHQMFFFEIINIMSESKSENLYLSAHPSGAIGGMRHG